MDTESLDRTAKAFASGLACGDPYATHLQFLGRALGELGPQSSVLELGCGHYSTPLLHGFCAAQARPLVTLESDAAWGAIFEDLGVGLHSLHLGPWTPEQIPPPPTGTRWGLVFIDCDMPLRGPAITRLMPCADQLVLHDACNPAYGYDQALAPFAHQRDVDTSVTPWTLYVRPRRT